VPTISSRKRKFSLRLAVRNGARTASNSNAASFHPADKGEW
jgi:hypothetical protein